MDGDEDRNLSGYRHDYNAVASARFEIAPVSRFSVRPLLAC